MTRMFMARGLSGLSNVLIKEVRIIRVQMASSAGGVFSDNTIANIEHIAAVSDGTTVWTIEEVIKLIENSEINFYVEDSKCNKAYIKVMPRYDGLAAATLLGVESIKKYITTCADGNGGNNLLSLPEGPFFPPDISFNGLGGLRGFNKNE